MLVSEMIHNMKLRIIDLEKMLVYDKYNEIDFISEELKLKKTEVKKEIRKIINLGLRKAKKNGK